MTSLEIIVYGLEKLIAKLARLYRPAFCMAQLSVSRHLKILIDYELVRSRKKSMEGSLRYRFYFEVSQDS